MLTGGYAYLGQKSFQGAPALGLHTLFPVGQHLAVGVLVTAARARQEYPLYLWNFGGGRTVNTLHNHLFSAQALLGYRLSLTDRLGFVTGPTVGYTAVGRREQGTSDKVGAGLWANITYRRIFGSRFHLEGLVNPRLLLKGPQAEDGDLPFATTTLWVWEGQAGISYGLGL
ncbi:hypothetical protein GCM10022406_35160 [Hymenobacter algoricola]|uniref:DUF3575 domain-containing protein n=2 Tax=Hymenobacter algoricola TaxID=486267 RepID=A0ABP7NME0_9BACT